MKHLLKSNDRLLLNYSMLGLAVFYLNLTWKTTGDWDRLTTDGFFLGAILWLLWQRKDSLKYDSNFISSLLGLLIIVLVLFKSISLFWFESILLPLIPLFVGIGMALIACGIRGLNRYWKELFFAWFLFFPTGVIGNFIDKIVPITVLNAKFATYFLYYFGFNVASKSNQVLLSLPERGEFKAIVDYPCAGVPMILLMLKLALLLVCFYSLPKTQQILVPIVSIVIGFILGVIRVCILTLMIPEPTKFAYWHGSSGAQIFSTLAIIIFSIFCYWILEYQQPTNVTKNQIIEPEIALDIKQMSNK